MDWKICGSAFLTVFLAEMGDKTQLASMTMTASTGKALSVFFGASLALVIVTALGVVVGQGVTKFVPEEYLKKGAALLFVGIGLWMFFKPN